MFLNDKLLNDQFKTLIRNDRQNVIQLSEDDVADTPDFEQNDLTKMELIMATHEE